MSTRTAEEQAQEFIDREGEGGPRPYVVDGGRICWRKHERDGEVLVPLCNFTAKIHEEVYRHDGRDEHLEFLVGGLLASGPELPSITVPASQFQGMNWVLKGWGTRAIVSAGYASRDRLREAIQSLSPDAERRYVYEHLGWRQVHGRPVFLTAAGAVGGSGVDVQVEQALERYALDAQPENAEAAMRASLRLLEVAPSTVTVPLWGATYLAPLSEFLSPDFLLWVLGSTGKLKSTLAALFLSHYGDFNRLNLPANFMATANFLERLAFLAKDVVLVVDDFVPQESIQKQRELEDKAQRLVRAQGNRQGRGRMRADTTLRSAYFPRGVVVVTGEQLLSGQSANARIFVVQVEESPDLGNVTEAQGTAHLLPRAMSAYVQWLAKQHDSLQADLPRAWRELRAEAGKAGSTHLRQPEAVAYLYLGVDMALNFATELGALTGREADELRRTAWDSLVNLTAAQQQNLDAESPSSRFIEAIGALLVQGQVVILPKEAPDTPPPVGKDAIGWSDLDFIYLEPGAVFNRVSRFLRDEGSPPLIKRPSLWKALVQDGVTIPGTDGRSTIVEYIGGTNRRVLKLPRNVLDRADENT